MGRSSATSSFAIQLFTACSPRGCQHMLPHSTVTAACLPSLSITPAGSVSCQANADLSLKASSQVASYSFRRDLEQPGLTCLYAACQHPAKSMCKSKQVSTPGASRCQSR